MKTLNWLCLVAAALITSSLFSQKSEYNYYYDWDYSRAVYEPIQYSPDQKVKEIRFTQTKGEKSKTYVKRYNSEGVVSYYGSVDEEGKQIPIYAFEFNEFGQRTLSTSYRKGAIKYTIDEHYQEDGGGRLLLEKRNSKGKLMLKNTWQYKTKDCLSESNRFKGNGQLKRKWVYSYYNDCERKQTDLYNGKGMLIKSWSYDCKQEGEIVAKKKDTIQTCKWEESDGEYLLKIYQTLDEKGKIRKHIAKYTLKDTLIVEHSAYNGEDQLMYKNNYDQSYQKMTHSVVYRKGEKWSERIYTYEGDLLKNHEYYFKGKLRSKSTYQYEDEMLVSLKQIGKNGKEVFTQLEYPQN